MAEKMISDLAVATGLDATDKFEIEQDSRTVSTYVTVAMLLDHINTNLVQPVADDVASVQLSIGNTTVTLEQVNGRLVTAEGDIDALQTALATETTNRTNANTTINTTITTLSGRVTTNETDIGNLQTAVAGKAALVHTHAVADVTGLQTALDGKAATVHTHTISAVTGLQTALDGKEPANANIQSHISVINGNPHGTTKAHVGLSNVDNTSDANKPVSTAQQAVLDGKAALVHTHVIGDVTGLQSALNGKAALVHTHAIADVTGLQTALDNASATTTEVVTARGAFATLDDRLDNLAVSAGAVTSVFGRAGDIAAQTGDYTFAQIGSKPTTLSGYGITDAAALVHVHSAADITSGVLSIARGGTNGEGFRYIEADTAPTGQPVGTRWLDTTTSREYTLTSSGWVQWSGAQPVNGQSLWGTIGGTLSDQTDLQTALNAKAAISGQVFTGAVTATALSDASGNVRNLLPVTANAATTLDATHINKVVEKTNGTAYTYTISASLGAQGDVITIINSGTTGDITVARGTGVALYRGTTDQNITVAPGTMATLYRTGTANRWMA